jgi:hypothetical protein
MDNLSPTLRMVILSNYLSGIRIGASHILCDPLSDTYRYKFAQPATRPKSKLIIGRPTGVKKKPLDWLSHSRHQLYAKTYGVRMVSILIV